MPRDFIPAPDAEFSTWLNQFASNVQDLAVDFGLTPAEVTTLTDAAGAYTTTFTSQQSALATARGLTATKRAQRRTVIDVVRPLAKRLQSHPAMTDSLRATLGLTLPDTGPRLLLTSTPTDVPLVELDFGTRGQITVHFGPNPANEARNGLPPGCLGVVLQARIVSGEVTPDGLGTTWQYLDNPSSSPYTHLLHPTTVTTVAYRCCYLYTRTRRGPWSNPVQAACTPAA